MAKLETLIAAYNAATLSAEAFMAKLKDYCDELEAEDCRHVREGLTEAELAVFDLLTRPDPTLTRIQEVGVKATARTLLAKLKELIAVRDWHARQQPRAAVLSAIREELDSLPDEPFPSDVWNVKVEAVWQHVFSRYGTAGASVH